MSFGFDYEGIIVHEKIISWPGKIGMSSFMAKYLFSFIHIV